MTSGRVGAPTDPRSSVAVVGGGVIGLTTAIALEAAGYSTIVITDRPNVVAPGSVAPPDLASVHAAASVLPHSVRAPRAVQWTDRSTTVFDALLAHQQPGLRVQRHFELFEHEVSEPDYAPALRSFRAIDDARAQGDRVAPIRTGAPTVAGWSFDAYFCEGPPYLAGLTALYQAVGGSIVEGIATLDGLLADGWRAIVLCAGHRTPEIAEAAAGLDAPDAGAGWSSIVDPHPMRYILGHYIRAPLTDLLRGSDGQVVSYNYHPPAEIYASSPNESADVYCYARHDAWLLGGSRQQFPTVEAAIAAVRAPDQRGTVLVPDAAGGSIAVPYPILLLNQTLIASLAAPDLDLSPLDPSEGQLWGGFGLRAERSDPVDSTRVELSRLDGPRGPVTVAHNYGHGGAGFTLSWGCAAEVVNLLRSRADADVVAHDPRRSSDAAPVLRALTAALASN